VVLNGDGFSYSYTSNFYYYLAKSNSLIPSKYGWFKASYAVNLSSGFNLRVAFIKFNAFFEIFPKYLFSKVSGFPISGNFIPFFN